MREFIPTRRGIAPPLPAAASFRNNEKDEGLASIMERRRQMADSEKVATNDSSTNFAPRSSRMSTTLNKKVHQEISGTSDVKSVGSTSTATPPQPPPSPSSNALNELQKAMLRRRTKVEDTTIPIVSPRQQRRSSRSEHNKTTSIMSPTLQEKLQKQLLMSDSSPKTKASPTGRRASIKGIEIPKVSLSALSSFMPKSSGKNKDRDDQSRLSSGAGSVEESTASSRRYSVKSNTDSPKVSLSVLPSPIPTSPSRNSANGDDQSRLSSKSGSSGRLTRLQHPSTPNERDDESHTESGEEEEVEEEEVEVESVSESEEETETSVPNPDSDDELFFHSAKYDTDNFRIDVNRPTPNVDRATSVDHLDDSDNNSDNDSDNVNNENGFSSNDSPKGENSNCLPVSSDNSSNQEKQPTFRQRRAARRKKKPTNLANSNDNNNNVRGDERNHESGQTFFDPSNSTDADRYPVASDSEDEYDPYVITSFAHADSFNYKKVSKPANITDDENEDSVDFDKSVDDDENSANPGFETSDDEAMSHDNFNASTDNETMLRREDSQSYEEETVEEIQNLQEDDYIEEEVVDNESVVADGVFQDTDGLSFKSEQQHQDEFSSFGNDEEDIEQQRQLFSQEDSHGESSPFSKRSNPSRTSSIKISPKSFKNDTADNNLFIVGNKSLSTSGNKHIPMGVDDNSDSDSDLSNTKHDRSSKKQVTLKARVCSRPVLITLILVGSLVIGACIGFFFLGAKGNSSSTALPVNNNTTFKPDTNDPTRSSISSEQLATYDSICPLLLDCTRLIDSSTPSGKAFNWLVNNKTANPDVEGIPNENKIRRYALAALYFSTGGDSWVDNAKWLSVEDECKWFSSAESGSGCGREGQSVFTSLELDMNNLVGELPYELSLLTDLKTISIRNPTESDKVLKGTLPTHIGKLTSLTTLMLSGNHFTSGIPTEIGSCQLLETLDFSSNGFNGEIPGTFSSLTNLTTLNLEGNYFAGNVDSEIFEGAKNLVNLNLHGNKLTGLPDTIASLDNLKVLLVGSNQFTTIPLVVTQIPALKILDLSGNGMWQSIPAQFGRMTSLEQLDLSNNKLLGGIPVELGNLVNLEFLLDLSINDLSGTIPSRLGQLVLLRRLRLDGNRLSGIVPAELANLNKIEEIRFDDNNLEGTVPQELCDLYNVLNPASYADCDELQNPTCITNCCTKDLGCVCQFEKTDPLLCIKNLQ